VNSFLGRFFLIFPLQGDVWGGISDVVFPSCLSSIPAHKEERSQDPLSCTTIIYCTIILLTVAATVAVTVAATVAATVEDSQQGLL
jgi:hypothetical protein